MATQVATAPPVRTARPVMGAAAVLLAGALVAVVVGAVVGGAAEALPLLDPGPLVRWGVLVARTVMDLASATTVGLLVLAAFLTPETTRTNRRIDATRLAAQSAVLWVVAAAISLVTTFASLAGYPLSNPDLPSQFASLVFGIEATSKPAISLFIAAVVAVGAAVVTTRAGMAWMAALSLVSLMPLALAGHSAGSSDHETAVNALAFHLVGVALWVGGLVALALMRPALGRDLGITVARFSTIAGVCYVLVMLSGFQSAWIRIGDLGGLATAYGAIIVGKTVALVLLGVAGWAQRRVMIRRLRESHADTAAFVRLVLTELTVMGVAIGLAVALSRSAPPVPEDGPIATPAERLSGFPAPAGPLEGSGWLTTWRIDYLWLTMAVVAVGLYLVGVARLRRRGDAWPIHRPILWTLGWALFVYAACGAPGVYGRVQFSVHMVEHMVIAMVVPLLLVPAAPITLALRTITARKDRTWGPREVILQITHSRALQVLANPVVAAGVFFFSLAIFYYSPLFNLGLSTHTGHILMVLHFLTSGYLFTWALVGIDPGPKRWPPLMLLVILFATISFHAFFGVVLTGSSSLLAPEFFGQLDISWITDAVADQQRGGAIAWGVGEAPTLVLAMLVTLAWVRTDRAETKRFDRQADRDGNAALAAYNAQLAQRKAAGERVARRDVPLGHGAGQGGAGRGGGARRGEDPGSGDGAGRGDDPEVIS